MKYLKKKETKKVQPVAKGKVAKKVVKKIKKK